MDIEYYKSNLVFVSFICTSINGESFLVGTKKWKRKIVDFERMFRGILKSGNKVLNIMILIKCIKSPLCLNLMPRYHFDRFTLAIPLRVDTLTSIKPRFF